jgi:hypothetical protein
MKEAEAWKKCEVVIFVVIIILVIKVTEDEK